MKNLFPIWRSMLFIPTHIEKFVSKAHTRGADAYILDLEDSVPDDSKALARDMLPLGAKQVAAGGAAALVRVNQPWAETELDLQAAVGNGIRAVVLPKVDDPEYVRAAADAIRTLEMQRDVEVGQTLLIAQIEDVAALPKLDDIATSSPRLMGMILGSEDFSASAGMEPIAEALFGPNQAVLFSCRRAGIQPFGFPGSIADYSDAEGFRRTIKLARRLGFVGAFCIHPSQVPILNEEFLPSAEDIKDAKGILAAYADAHLDGKGAAHYRGKMIDRPIVARAEELLRRCPPAGNKTQ